MSKQPGAQRFVQDNLHKERVVFLFDLLYEAEHAFKKQHWLGAVVQQVRVCLNTWSREKNGTDDRSDRRTETL